MTVDVSVLGDAVHNVLVHLARKPLGFDEDFGKRLTELEAGTAQWHTFPVAYQQRVRAHWLSIGKIYCDAKGVWLEPEGVNGLRVDMARRMPDVWEVIEFKTADTHSLNQTSRKQVRDMMAKLKATLPADTAIKGYRVYLPLDLDVPADPVWKEVMFATKTPAS